MCKVFELIKTGRSESRNRLNLKHENELSLFLCEFCVQFMKFNYSNGRFVVNGRFSSKRRSLL